MLIFTLQKEKIKRKEKGPEKIFEDIRAENILSFLGKETLTQVQEIESLSYSINPERNTP